MRTSEIDTGHGEKDISLIVATSTPTLAMGGDDEEEDDDEYLRRPPSILPSLAHVLHLHAHEHELLL